MKSKNQFLFDFEYNKTNERQETDRSTQTSFISFLYLDRIKMKKQRITTSRHSPGICVVFTFLLLCSRHVYRFVFQFGNDKHVMVEFAQFWQFSLHYVAQWINVDGIGFDFVGMAPMQT